jgi:hypothetical protein
MLGYSLPGSQYTTPEHKYFCKCRCAMSVDQLGSNHECDTHLGVKVFPGRILEGFLVLAPPSVPLFSATECCAGTPSEASVEMFVTFMPCSIGLSGRSSGGGAVPPPEYGAGSRETTPWPMDRADISFICTSDGKVTPAFSFEVFIVKSLPELSRIHFKSELSLSYRCSMNIPPEL